VPSTFGSSSLRTFGFCSATSIVFDMIAARKYEGGKCGRRGGEEEGLQYMLLGNKLVTRGKCGSKEENIRLV
jgi:hypothetical protein